MTYTEAIGKGCKLILDRIVRGLALARIHPNVLTFIGLMINTVAAVLFGYGAFLPPGWSLSAPASSIWWMAGWRG